MEKENIPDRTTASNMGDASISPSLLEPSEPGCCPFDVFTPEALVSRFKTYDDCTEDIIKLIRSVHVCQNKIKKLCRVFDSLSNYDTGLIVNLTRDGNRMLRYVSTYLMLNKIKQWVIDGRGFEVVEAMYDEVFLVRFRDVDFNIRAACVEFMCEWIISAPGIFNLPCYLKYIGWALSDKNDSVRRKGISSCTRLVRKKINVQGFVSRFKSRIIELSLYDRSPALRDEGKALCMELYIGGMVSKDDVYKVLRSMNEGDKKGLMSSTIRKILGTEEPSDRSLLENHEGLHELLSNTSLFICSCIPHSGKDVEGFIDFILDFLRTKNSCCQSKSLCYLRILGVLSGSGVDVEKYHRIFEIVKDSRENTAQTVEAISKVDPEVFRRHPDATNRLLEAMKDLLAQYKCEEMFSRFVHLLKKLEKDFPAFVHRVVESLKSSCVEFVHCAIKSFDISESVENNFPSEIKCYAALWKIMSEDYERVNGYEFKKIGNLSVLCDFLLFFREKCIEFGVVNRSVERASDQGECFKIMYDRLSVLIHSQAEDVFTDQKGCISLFKLVDGGLFVDYSSIIFRTCNLELISEFLGKSKSKMNLVSGYFRYLMDVEEKDVDKKVGRLVGSRCSMAKRGLDTEKVVFRGMKELIELRKVFLYDTVLIYFVSSLTANECIIIEQGLEKSRLKASLLRRIREG
ncbi:cohesin [Encephalitozoon intestinalis ATCC 50506]|uniref:Cohesin n=1 Tax=Encephalitozoon intestinalis (strain ATCC 50506) TaxID=876142 RepID=E0S6N7_ENCIT|nr:cohesin [Encephalitozoon intestinalis ATCC 50506]ADM11372.1 cohesin [Encephalitozoon intestinalis ATCC 50506]UTX45062.1 cohesin [Encephalitozoon intestinalis]